MNDTPGLAATIYHALKANPDAAVTLDTTRLGHFTYHTALGDCEVFATYDAVFAEYRVRYYEPHYYGTSEFLAADTFATLAYRHVRQNSRHCDASTASGAFPLRHS